MIGREAEIRELERLYDSERAELVAIYGRRRVGKTFLVDRTFEGRMTFRHTGLSPIERPEHGMLQGQLENFCHSLTRYGVEISEYPRDWLDAFFLLEQYLDEIYDGDRQVVFIDELPWMDTPKSGFLTGFEAFWNGWACNKNVLVIVCGSASAWMLDRLINNHGGLYNRVTYEIRLAPFTLAECEEYYKYTGVNLSRYDITQSYMILGGIPYYMSYFEKGRSLAQNIDRLFFSRNAKLANEYDRLFSSIFSNAGAMKAIVEFLYTKNAGYTRDEMADKLPVSNGGSLTRYLNALISADFVISYVPFGYGRRQVHYKLTDPFCIFYLHFVKNHSGLDTDFWQQNVRSQTVVSWRGFAYENVCFNHIDRIKAALGIAGVASSQSAWSKRDDDEDGVQIDMLISRNDNIINLCEMKFYGDDFTVDKAYYRTMLHRQTVLSEMVSKRISVNNTLITTFGVRDNEYKNIFSNVITMDDLF